MLERMHAIEESCRILKVSRSGYYAWLKRAASERAETDAGLGRDIRGMFKEHGERYGSPRIRALLLTAGRKHSRKRIARIMRESGLMARKARKFTATTRANLRHRHAPNVLNREFYAEHPNCKWVSDITLVPTLEGNVYLAVTLDLFSRRVIGWSMADSMTAGLTTRAFDMAHRQRGAQRPLLHHSDRGSQYSDRQFSARLSACSVTQSMSRKGDVWDNAVSESFFATLEKELLKSRRFATRLQAMRDVFHWIESYYNRTRLHSTLGYLSPVQFEANYWERKP